MQTISLLQTNTRSSGCTLQHAELSMLDEPDIIAAKDEAIGNVTLVSDMDFTSIKQYEQNKYFSTSYFGSESDQSKVTKYDGPRSDGISWSFRKENMNVLPPRRSIESNHTAWSPDDMVVSPVKSANALNTFHQNDSITSNHSSQLRHVEAMTRTAFESMVVNQDDWQKQEHGCLTLTLIMKEQWFAAYIISREGGAKHVLTAMNLYQDFLDVQKAGIETLFFLTCDYAGRISTIEQRGIEHVIWAMRQFVKDRELVLNGASCLSNMSYRSEIAKKRIGKLGGIDVVVDVMDRHGDDRELQVACCLALRNFTTKAHANQWAAGRVCAIEAIVRGMKKFPDELNLHSNGCVAIGNMCENEAKNRERADMAGATEKVISVIQSSVGYVSVAENCLFAIRNITKRNEQNQDHVRDLGGLHAVVQCLQLHKTSINVLESGCKAILSLLFSPRNRVSFYECGGIEALISVLSEQRENTHVVYASLFALENATFNTPLSKMKVLEYGGIETLITIMECHLHLTSIQEHVCGIFRNLADSDENGIILLMSHPIIDDVLSSMSRYPTNANILEHGLAFLYNMSKCPEAICHMRDLPIISILENILEQNPNNPMIQVQTKGILKKVKASTLADVAVERNRFSNRKKLSPWVFSFSSILAPCNTTTRRAPEEQARNLSKRSGRSHKKKITSE